MLVILQKGHFELKKTLPFRSWFYFRTGYSQYFAFILAIVNMLTLTYYLAISNSPTLNSIFPSFTSYAIISIIIGIPILSFIGFLHMKRSPAFTSEQEVSAEANPYNYKLPPGLWKECIVPLLLELLILSKKNLNEEKSDSSDLMRLKELEKKFDLLAKGGSLPKPKKFDEIR